jgi:hypothetical protein
MSMPVLARLAALGLGIASIGACAELKFGLQGTLSLPLDDLKTLTDSGQGLGAGAFMDIRFVEGQALRPRVDFIQYPSRSGGGESRQWSCQTIGVDYLYFTQGRFQGPYLAAGLGSRNYEVKLDFNGRSSTGSNRKLGLTLGGGYVFTSHFEGNARYTRTAMDGGIQMGTLDLGVAYTF